MLSIIKKVPKRLYLLGYYLLLASLVTSCCASDSTIIKKQISLLDLTPAETLSLSAPQVLICCDTIINKNTPSVASSVDLTKAMIMDLTKELVDLTQPVKKPKKCLDLIVNDKRYTVNLLPQVRKELYNDIKIIQKPNQFFKPLKELHNKIEKLCNKLPALKQEANALRVNINKLKKALDELQTLQGFVDANMEHRITESRIEKLLETIEYTIQNTLIRLASVAKTPLVEIALKPVIGLLKVAKASVIFARRLFATKTKSRLTLLQHCKIAVLSLKKSVTTMLLTMRTTLIKNNKQKLKQINKQILQNKEEIKNLKLNATIKNTINITVNKFITVKKFEKNNLVIIQKLTNKNTTNNTVTNNKNINTITLAND